MALSKRPKKTENEKPSVSVEALIMKGGSSGGGESNGEEVEEKIVKVQLRIPTSKLDQIDSVKKKRPGKLSRHTWFMEAIEEKLIRETE